MRAANEIRAADDFEALHTVIRTKLTTVKGITNLGYYDIARRIGQWRRPKLEPTDAEMFAWRPTDDLLAGARNGPLGW